LKSPLVSRLGRFAACRPRGGGACPFPVDQLQAVPPGGGRGKFPTFILASKSASRAT
jgi:hypothetical protein